MNAPAILPDWLAHRAESTPSRIALVAGERAWSFADLHADASRVARALASLGVRAGDRVATLLHNGAGPAVLVHAVLRCGATLVPLNTRLGAAEIAWQVGDARPRVVVVEARTAAVGEEASRGGGGVQVVAMETLLPAGTRGSAGQGFGARPNGDGAEAGMRDDVVRGGPPAPEPPRLAHPVDHVLAIIYTSGTTGRPKGAMLTVGNFWWSAIGSALNLGTHADDRWLAVLPLFHVGGLSILLRSAIYGITAIVHDGFDEHAVNRAIHEEGVTIVSVVAATLQRMLAAQGATAYPTTLRCVLLGGGPAPRPLLERCAAAHVPVVQTYGLTETASQLATLTPDDALRKLGSAGRALYPNEIRIATSDDGIASDGAGEILVRGPVVMAGYAGRTDETARTIVNGWLHTGDIGRLDDEGYLYVLDRRDDLVITGGENVYPAEVEAVLLSHPSVAEAGVVGLPDERWGQRVVAVVRFDDDDRPSGATLRAYCRERLAAYKTPSEIVVVTEALPRTASGKLRRIALREMIGARADDRGP